MKSLKSSSLFLILTIAALLCGCGAAYVQYGARSQAAAEVARLRAQLEDDRKIKNELETSNSKLSESLQKLAHLDQSVAENAYIPTLLTELETIGKQNGIIVTGVRPKEDKSAKTAKTAKTDNPEKGKKSKGKAIASKKAEEILLEVRGSGNFEHVRKFMSALDRFPKVVAITTLAIAPEKDQIKAAQGLLEIRIEMKAFLFRNPKPTMEAANQPGEQNEPS